MDNPDSNRPRLVNAEPLLFLYSLGIGVYITVYSAFITFKVCLSVAKDSPVVPPMESVHDFCMDLVGSARDSHTNASNDLRDEIEEKSTEFMIYYQIANNVPAILIAFMVGAWSDAFGRKPPIIFALAGSTVGAFIVLAAAVWDKAPLYLILISTFVNGCTGQVLVIYSGAFAMISDSVPDPVQLTVRIGLASGILSSGFFVASLLSGVVLAKWDDYSIMFTASTVFVAAAFFYTVFLARETLQLVKPLSPANRGSVTIQEEANQVLDDASEVENSGVLVTESRPSGCCRTLLDVGRVRESLATLTRPRPGRHRLYLWISLIGFLVVFSSGAGMPGILVLLVKRPPISLSDSDVSYLIACSTGSMTLGMVILPWLAKRVLHTKDTSLIVFGLVMEVVKTLGIAFANSAWMIFVAMSVGSLSAVYFTGFRAFMSKLVDRDETGRIFAVVTSSEHIGPLISALVFNNIFAATLHSFAGCVYLVAGVCMGVVLLVMSWIHFDSSRRHDDVDQVDQAKEEEESDQRQLVE